MSLVSGTSDSVTISSGGKDASYFRLKVDGESLLALAEGPVTLALHFRAIGSGTSRGLLRIKRDDLAFSDNRYKADRDRSASAGGAGAEGNAVSEERVIHVPVPAGQHRLALSVLKGPSLAVRLFKASALDPALREAPERNAEGVPADLRVEEATPPPPQHDLPPLKPAPGTGGLESLQQKPAEGTVGGDLHFQEQAAPPLHVGMSIAIRGGTSFPLVNPNHFQPKATAPQANGRDVSFPADLELALDLGRNFSIFAEAEYEELLWTQSESVGEFGSVPASADSFMRLVPGMFGITALVPCCAAVGVRFRLGAAGAWVQDRPELFPTGSPGIIDRARHGWAYGGVGGISFDIAAGPGHVTIDGRYLFLRTNMRVKITDGPQVMLTNSGDLDQAQLLAGYRIEL